MKWSVRQLKAARGEPISIDEVISLEELKEAHPEIRDVTPFHVKGKGEYARSLIIFSLHIKGTLVLPCARTLADVHYPIDLHVTEKFYPKDERLAHVDEDDEDLHYYEGDIIDLLPAIRERVLLEIPMQVYASREVLERAPTSGEGWKIVTEEEKRDQIDPRLVDLAKFFEKE